MLQLLGKDQPESSQTADIPPVEEAKEEAVSNYINLQNNQI